MKLFLTVTALLAVADAGTNYNGNKILSGGYQSNQLQPQSIQGIINGLAAKGIGGESFGNNQGAASGYSYAPGVGSPLVGGYAIAEAPQVAYAPQHLQQYAPQVAAYAPQQLQQYAPQQQEVAYPPQLQQVAYAPQVEEQLEVAPGPSYADLPLQVSKSVFVFSAPVDPSDNIRPQIVKRFPQQKQKHYQVVFINAPNPPLPAQHTVELPTAPEIKTQIYVLVKKPQKAPPIKIIPSKAAINKPEVFFIRYKNQENGIGQDSGPILADPSVGQGQGQGYADQGPVEAPLADLTDPGYAQAGPQEPGQGYGPPENGPPHGGEMDYGAPEEQGRYVEEGPIGQEYREPEGNAEYVGAPGGYITPSGGLAGYDAISSSGGHGGPHGVSHGRPIEYDVHDDAYASYSKQYPNFSRIPVRRRRVPKPSSYFRFSSRSDSNDENYWKPMIRKTFESDAGMSGI